MTVSYLITLYNKEGYIGAVLDSTLAEQAETGGEIIIYDDCATDRSPEIVKERIAAHTAQANVVRVVRGDKNRGVAYGTNFLINAATQPYIRFVDADDELVVGSTAHLLRLMKANKLDFIYSRMVRKGEDIGSQTYSVAIPLKDPIDVVLRHFTGYLTASIFAADKIKKIGPIPEWVRRAPDFTIFLRMACSGVAIGGVNEVTALLPTAYNPGNLTSNRAAMYAELARGAAAEQDNIPLRNMRIVTRRYAGRATKYYRVEGKARLTLKEKFDLWCWRQFTFLATSKQTCAERLNRIAEILDYDKNVIRDFSKDFSKSA